MTIGMVKGSEPMVNTSHVSFKQGAANSPKVDLSSPVDTLEVSNNTENVQKAPVSKGKKVKAGILSAVFPGLGQACNGDKMKGLQIYAGHMGIGAYVLATLAIGALPAAIVGLGVLAAYDIANIVDAVKTAK